MINLKTHRVILKDVDRTDSILMCKSNKSGYFVKFKTGEMFNYNSANVKIVSLSADQININECIQYFNEIANSIGLKETNENGVEFNILSYYLQKVTSIDKDTILGSYLTGELKNNSLEKSSNNSEVIYPFGFNQSQKKAIDNALTNKLSIIEGPPGTGKTQTILNIISNIVLRGQNVAVVSGNNSAIQNVHDKLVKGEVDFIAAILGNKSNREKFIESQKPISDLSSWKIENKSLKKIKEDLKRNHKIISEKLEKKEELSKLKLELTLTETESRHFFNFYKKSNLDQELWMSEEIKSSDEALELWFVCDEQYMSQGNLFEQLIRKIKIFLFFWRKPERLINKKLEIYDSESLIQMFKYRFYELKISELSKKILSLEQELKVFDFDIQMKAYTESSLNLFKNYLADKYNKNSRVVFEFDELSSKANEFTREYPVILSTTYSLKASLDADYKYDYVIIDEASQVDLCTAFLALSCARNLIVVGDLMQLPQVVDKPDSILTDKIFHKYNLPEYLRYKNHSLLSSLVEVFPDVPKVLLREHYRCHPKIIDFCNKKFYGGQLIILTESSSADIPLVVYKTVGGNHARDRVNQRQIDVIKNEVIPEQNLNLDDGSVGIITPYRAQTTALKAAFCDSNVRADTVDKFQGQESRVVILSTVDNEVGEFTDNSNRLNVAISRAIEKLIVVVSASDLLTDRNIGDLVKYIEYNNFEVIDSKTNSIFDLLYKSYKEKRARFLIKYKKVSKYDSENLLHALLTDTLKEQGVCHLSIAIGAPLSEIISNDLELNEDEEKFVKNKSAHVDFLLYDIISKVPKLAIEVDGVAFHKQGSRQSERDQLKDQIFKKCEIPLLRLRTNGSGEREVIIKALKEYA